MDITSPPPKSIYKIVNKRRMSDFLFSTICMVVEVVVGHAGSNKQVREILHAKNEESW